MEKKSKTVVFKVSQENYDFMTDQYEKEGYDNLSAYIRRILFMYFSAGKDGNKPKKKTENQKAKDRFNELS